MNRYNVIFKIYDQVYQTIENCTTNMVISLEHTLWSWQQKGLEYTIEVQTFSDTTVIGK